MDFKIKRHPNVCMAKQKARSVAKDYLQIFGFNYTNSYALIAKVVTLRILLTMTAKQNWMVHQLDINNVLLHDHLEEDVFLIPSQGFKAPFGKVCKLKKAVYGLKQGPR